MIAGMVRLDHETIGYEARDDSTVRCPAILVFHEIVGMVDYLKEVTRNFAKHGYLGLAVDLYGGKTARGFEDGRLLRDKVTEELFRSKTGAALRYLKSSPYGSGRIGVVGFCMGGGFALSAACFFAQDVHACGIFYGRMESLDPLKNLEAPVWGNFGGEDPRITNWVTEELRPAMENLGKRLDFKIYPGARHAFHNPTIPEWHHPEAAKEAWDRTLGFFEKHLKEHL